MPSPPSQKIREVPLKSLDGVNTHSVHGVLATRQDDGLLQFYCASIRSLVLHLKQDTWPLFSDQFSCISTLRISPDGDTHDECLTLGCDRFLVTSQTPAEVRLRQEFGLNWPPQISKPVWVWYLLLPGRSGREQIEVPSSPIASTDLLFG